MRVHRGCGGIEFEADFNGLLYVYAGAVFVAEERSAVGAGHLVELGPGQGVRVRAGEQGGRYLLIAAEPIREAIVRRGPFVMNSEQEIVQAVRDYQSGAF